MPAGEERIAYRGELSLPGVAASDYAKRHGVKVLRKGRKVGALPDGYVDANTRYDVTVSATLQVLGDTRYSGGWEFGVYYDGMGTLQETIDRAHLDRGNRISFMGFSVYALAGYVQRNEDEIHGVAIVLVTPTGTRHVLELHEFDGRGYHTVLSSPVTVTYSYKNFRLGAVYTCTTPDAEGPALSYRHGYLRHDWFGDASTTIESTCAGYTYTENPYDTETNLGPYAGGVGFSCSIWTPGEDAAIFSNVTSSSGDINMDGLHNGCLVGSGNGAVGNSNNGGGYGIPTVWSGGSYFYPPVNVTYDLSITKYGKGVWTGAKLSDNWLTVARYNSSGVLETPHYADGLEIPFKETFVVPMTPWSEEGQGLKPGIIALESTFDIHPEWAAAQDPPLSPDDACVPVQGPTPRGGETYTPLSIALAQTIDVHRPDGNMPSQFVTSDEAKLTVSEGATETTFVVSAAGGSASRTLKTDWEPGVTKGDPAWSYVACRRTKHTVGDDVWCWDSHAYLDIEYTTNVAQTLTLTLDWRKITVTDTFATDSTRYDDWECMQTPGQSTYTVNLPVGTGTATVNLLFPKEGGPAFLGRIDRITLSGFTPGPSGPATVTIRGMKLVSKTDPESGLPLDWYLHIAPKPPVRQGVYTLASIAHDGASITLQVPDTAYKGNEVTVYGGSPRYVEPCIGATSGLIFDTQFTLSGYANELNNLEGVTATYDAAASEEAISDGTNTLAPENADWLIPQYPTSVAQYRAWLPKPCPAAVMCRRFGITNGIPWTVKVDHALMAAKEVLTYEGNAPGEAGITLRAYWMDGETKQIVDGASGTTDAAGFAVVAPIPANGSRAYSVEQVPE